MRKILLSIACLFTIAFLNFTESKAQDTVTRVSTLIEPPLFTGNQGFRTWSIGLHGGALAPFAASGGNNDFSKWVPTLGYGAYIKYQISHALGLQLDFLKGTLKANNDKLWAGAPPVSPFKSFSTNINWATSLSAVVTLGNINWSQLHTSIQPYASIGGGGINFNPTTVSATGAVVEFKPVGSLTEFYVPFGLGIKANLSPSVNLDLGYTMAYVDADNLDGYFKPPYQGDRFSYLHIGLEFALGSAQKPQLARHNPPAQLSRNMNEQDAALRASLAASEERYNQRLAEINGLRDDVSRMKTDTDGDGVSDYFDKCPNTPRTVKVDGAGCPLPVAIPQKDTVVKIMNNNYIITEEDKKIVREAISNLEFDFAKSTIRARCYPYLNKVADMLVKKGFSLKLGGHTDNVGSNAANLRLSKDRVESVKHYLISQGAGNERIEAVGYGESQPISSNKTAKGRQENRRVEFTLY